MKDLFSVDFKGLFKGLVFSILGTALIICLFFIAYGLVFNLVTSNPEKVKGVLQRSSLYSDLPSVLYDQTTIGVEGGRAEIPLKDPKIRQIALDVYNPEFVQSNTEKLIDGVYGWLEGKTEKPVINLDFTEKNQEFVNKISKYLKKQAVKTSLVTPAEAEKTATRADNLLLENKLTAKDIKTADGEPVQDSFSNFPQSFSLAKTIPYALIVIALVLLAIIFYLSKDRTSALKRISRSLLLAGVLIALTPFIFLFCARLLLKKSSDDEQVINIIRTLFEQFMHEADKVYYITGAVIILIAIGLYVYSRKIQNTSDKISKTKR